MTSAVDLLGQLCAQIHRTTSPEQRARLMSEPSLGIGQSRLSTSQGSAQQGRAPAFDLLSTLAAQGLSVTRPVRGRDQNASGATGTAAATIPTPRSNYPTLGSSNSFSANISARHSVDCKAPCISATIAADTKCVAARSDHALENTPVPQARHAVHVDHVSVAERFSVWTVLEGSGAMGFGSADSDFTLASSSSSSKGNVYKGRISSTSDCERGFACCLAHEQAQAVLSRGTLGLTESELRAKSAAALAEREELKRKLQRLLPREHQVSLQDFLDQCRSKQNQQPPAPVAEVEPVPKVPAPVDSAPAPAPLHDGVVAPSGSVEPVGPVGVAHAGATAALEAKPQVQQSAAPSVSVSTSTSLSSSLQSEPQRSESSVSFQSGSHVCMEQIQHLIDVIFKRPQDALAETARVCAELQWDEKKSQELLTLTKSMLEKAKALEEHKKATPPQGNTASDAAWTPASDGPRLEVPPEPSLNLAEGEGRDAFAYPDVRRGLGKGPEGVPSENITLASPQERAVAAAISAQAQARDAYRHELQREQAVYVAQPSPAQSVVTPLDLDSVFPEDEYFGGDAAYTSAADGLSSTPLTSHMGSMVSGQANAAAPSFGTSMSMEVAAGLAEDDVAADAGSYTGRKSNNSAKIQFVTQEQELLQEINKGELWEGENDLAEITRGLEEKEMVFDEEEFKRMQELLPQIESYFNYLEDLRQEFREQALVTYKAENSNPNVATSTPNAAAAIELLNTPRFKSVHVSEPLPSAAAATLAAQTVVESPEGAGASGAEGDGFSLSQQSSTGYDINDPRYIGSKLVASISLADNDPSIEPTSVLTGTVTPLAPEEAAAPATIITTEAEASASQALGAEPSVVATAALKTMAAALDGDDELGLSTAAPVAPAASAGGASTVTSDDVPWTLPAPGSTEPMVKLNFGKKSEDSDDPLKGDLGLEASSAASDELKVVPVSSVEADRCAVNLSGVVHPVQGDHVVAASVDAAAAAVTLPEQQHDQSFTSPRSAVARVDGTIDHSAEKQVISELAEHLAKTHEAQRQARSGQELSNLKQAESAQALNVLDMMGQHLNERQQLFKGYGASDWYVATDGRTLPVGRRNIKIESAPKPKLQVSSSYNLASTSTSHGAQGPHIITTPFAPNTGMANVSWQELEQDLAFMQKLYAHEAECKAKAIEQLTALKAQGRDLNIPSAILQAARQHQPLPENALPSPEQQGQYVSFLQLMPHAILPANLAAPSQLGGAAPAPMMGGASAVPAAAAPSAVGVGGSNLEPVRGYTPRMPEVPDYLKVDQQELEAMYASELSAPPQAHQAAPQPAQAPLPPRAPMPPDAEASAPVGDSASYDGAGDSAVADSYGESYGGGGGGGYDAAAGLNFDADGGDEDDYGGSFSGNIELDLGDSLEEGQQAPESGAPSAADAAGAGAEAEAAAGASGDSAGALHPAVILPAVKGKKRLTAEDYLPAVAEQDPWYKLILSSFEDAPMLKALLSNVERRVDPSDETHWILLVDQHEDLSLFADVLASSLSGRAGAGAVKHGGNLWQMIEERFEQAVGHKLKLEVENTDSIPENAPTKQAERLAAEALKEARSDLSGVQGLGELLSILHEDLHHVGLELYTAEDSDAKQGL